MRSGWDDQSSIIISRVGPIRTIFTMIRGVSRSSLMGILLTDPGAGGSYYANLD